jgi:tape measure domain-containing protein
LTSFADLTARLNLNIANFATNLQRATTQANRFASNLQGQINSGMAEPAKKAKFEFKDVARIVQGIIVSKIFYSGLNSIRNATDAVWDFSKSIEYAQMVYSTLFKDTALAKEFINVLKDFAAVTPFTFEQSEAAAKRLLAYGIQYQNVMYVMQGVLAASTAQQRPEVIESISRAIGQIYTKGRLMNEEMRQLAEAGIPAYEILRKKLGLTQKQLQNLGKQSIPASKAINALIDGINERFGSTLKMSSLTTMGILSNIKDNALMLFSGIFKPFTDMLHNMLASFGEFMLALRNALELRGIGGVFVTLIPPELQESVRVLIANLLNLWNIVKTNLTSIFTVFKDVAKALVNVLNMLLPIFNALAGFTAAFTKALVENKTAMKLLISAIMACAAAWVVYRLQGMLSAAVTVVIKGMIQAIKVLIISLNFLIAHPIWALLALGVGLFVGLAGASNSFAASIRNVLSAFTSLGGIDASKILLPETKEREADLNKFNKRLGQTSDKMDELADSINKASKGLLSFDEVFKLTSNSETPGFNEEDIIDGIGSFSMDPQDIWDGTNFDNIARSFVDNLLGALGGTSRLLEAGIGSLLGGVLGMILGGPLGAMIGMLAGTIAGWFWEDVAKFLGLTDVGKIALPIATVLGASIGGILGGPLGALVGGTIGALVGWIVDSIAYGIEKGDWSKVSLPIGIGLGAAIGMLVGGPGGALIGAGIGAVIGLIAKMFIEGFQTGKWDIQGISVSIGGALGAAIGMVVGGPIGALLGVAIGALVGWIASKFIEADWSKVGQAFLQPWKDFGNMVSSIFLDFIWKPIKNAWDKGDWASLGANIVLGIIKGLGLGVLSIPTAVGTLFMSLWNSICEIFGIHSPATTMDPIGENIVLGILKGIVDTTDQLLGSFSKMCSDLLKLAGGLLEDLKSSFSTWSTDAINLFSSWKTAVADKFNTLLNDMITSVGNWSSNMLSKFENFFSGMQTKLANWSSNVSTKVQLLFSGIITNTSNFATDIATKISTLLENMYTTVTIGTSNIFKVFLNWIGSLWNNVFSTLFGWLDQGISKLREFLEMQAEANASSSSDTSSSSGSSITGHAVGGIFNREHIARFAEGNKAEAIIPLENEEAMQPFVAAISNGIIQGLLPTLVAMQGKSNQQDPDLQRLILVGTLIADERGLKELNRKIQVIQRQENARRGL